MTAEAAPARCLDITRLVSRTGRTLTGVDRVELAYLKEFLARETPAFFLARTSAGYAILDRAGGAAVLNRVEGRIDWGSPDLTARLSRRLTSDRRRAEADLRRLSIAGAWRFGLPSRLRQIMPRGTEYVNVGHSNLTDRVLAAWRAVPGSRITVLIHDTIPLDFPQYQRPESVDRFRDVLRRVARHADRIIANSSATAQDIARHLSPLGRVPDILAASLGVEPAAPCDLPSDIPTDRPYFVCLGTIEPRKNHALLIDVWDRIRAEEPDVDRPRLVIAGARGWRNEAVFARLDRERSGDGLVIERAGLTDAEVSALLSASHGLLFPSHAEGFGLPAVEAALLDVRVMASDLPVFRELLADYCVYAPADDVYFWKQRIMAWARNERLDRAGETGVAAANRHRWQTHFNIVFGAT